MAKLWTLNGKLIMREGVLCYQDSCPCVPCENPGYLSNTYTFHHPALDVDGSQCCEDGEAACADMEGDYTLDYMGKIDYPSGVTLYWWQSDTFELEGCDWFGLGAFIWQLRIKKSTNGYCTITLVFGRASRFENDPEVGHTPPPGCGPDHSYHGQFKEDCVTIEITGWFGGWVTCDWDSALPFDLEPE